MNKNSKKILILISIVVIALIAVITFWPDNRTYMQYSEFIANVNNGNVSTAYITSNDITFICNDSKRRILYR